MPLNVKLLEMADETGVATKKPSFDVDGYNEVVAKAELAFIRLIDLNFKVDSGYLPANEGDQKDFRSFDGKMLNFFYSPDKGLAAGTFKWSVTIRRNRKIVVKHFATYRVLYVGVTELKEESVKKYVERVGKIASFPYFRALTSHLDVEAGTRLPPLPVLRA